MATLANVLPSFTNKDVIHRRGIYPKLAGQLFRTSPVCMKLAHKPNQGFRIFRGTVPLANAGSTAPLLSHVGDILQLGTEEKMIGVDTGRYIAPMKNVQSFWDRANRQLPGRPMSEVTFPSNVEPSVTGRVMPCYPKPARISLEYLFPKSLKKLPLSGALVTFLRAIDARSRMRSLEGCLADRAYADRCRLIRHPLAWYTFHVSDLLTRLLASPRTFAASRGLLVPNYSTNGGA